MKIKSLLLGFFLLTTVSTNYNCDALSPACQDQLADMVTEVALQGTISIIAGTPFAIPNLIENIAATVSSCKGDIITLAAGASKSRLKVDFDESGNASYGQNVVNNNFDVPPIESGDGMTENFSMMFMEPGDYRLITFCDDKNNVEERDEDNNESASEYVDAGRFSKSVREPLYIKVLPNPDFVKPQGAPNVVILSRTISSN